MRPDKWITAQLEQMTRDKKRTSLVLVSITLILFPVAYSLVRYLVTDTTQIQPFLELPDKQYTKCVRDTVYMRFHHMDLLKQVREEVIREGKRGDIKLSGCRECHTERGRFCNQCHAAVSLNVDCFGCHYYPETL